MQNGGDAVATSPVKPITYLYKFGTLRLHSRQKVAQFRGCPPLIGCPPKFYQIQEQIGRIKNAANHQTAL